MQHPDPSDRSPRGLVRAQTLISSRRLRGSERGQATTEFALILLPLLIVVAGIVYFGIGLNYWLDMQRIANQGARWAAVNNWPPECLRSDATCTNTPACDASPRTQVALQNTLRCQAIADGLQDSVQVDVCYPLGTKETGDPVRVKLTSDFTFFFIDAFTVELVGEATMRLEQSQLASDGGKITGDVGC